MTDTPADPFALPETARIGRTALRVGELDAVRPFYRDALGFEIEDEADGARLAAGDEPLLRLIEAPAAPDRTREQAGLFHVAVRVPDRTHLANALGRIREADVSLTGASDHAVSEALYLRDPEGNGVEIYCDRPRSEWERTEDGHVEMETKPLDPPALARASDDPGSGLPDGADVGHVHLEVTDVDDAESFYRDGFGMNVRARYGEAASFLAAGDYHHHVGLNTWNNRTAPAGDGRGLAWFEVVVPDEGTLTALRERLDDAGYTTEKRDAGFAVSDPDGIEVRVRT